MALDRGLEVRSFKKGPDYIDAAWLSWAARRPARNLDSFLMGFAGCLSSFVRHATEEGLNLIEGNRGLFDGLDARGTHSTAELAKLLRAPVILVVDATKMTRTAAALILGCRALDPELNIAGVIFNRVAGRRHEDVLRAAVENAAGVPVLGAVQRKADTPILPQRHLGLITPSEHRQTAEFSANLSSIVAGKINLQQILAIAGQVPELNVPATPDHPPLPHARGVKIGVLKDSAFSFYYPENLEALESAGARLSFISSLDSSSIPPDLEALYIGGGFPEMHAAQISANRPFLESLRSAAAGGLPIYAECGGLMLLSERIRWRGREHPMAGFLQVAVDMYPTPQGHGYVELLVDRPNPFFPMGLRIKGHEFHYSAIARQPIPPPTVCQVLRGQGCYESRDGIAKLSTWASYAHVHASATPEWAAGLLRAALSRAR